MNDVGPPPYGRGVPWRDATYVAVDLELTGLDPGRDQIVSFGAVPIRQGRIVLSEAVYREVEPSIPSSAAAISVHHLRAQDLAGNHDIHHEKASLAQALQGRFMVAWAAEIEITFLRKLFGGTERVWRRRTIDVRELAFSMEDPEESLRPGVTLSSAADRYCVPREAAHDAMGDALTTAQLYLVLAHRVSASRGHPIAVRRLLRMGRWRS